MVDEFNPGRAPSYGYQKKTKPRILRTDFGDGYSQRAADGLNSVAITVDLEFNGLTPDEADDIEAFLESKKGATAFTYTLPDEVSARKWTAAAGWNRTAQSHNLRTITVTLEEAFDI